MPCVTKADMTWRVRHSTLDCSARTLVMGILNVTPDSFSDGGRHFDPEVAVAAGTQMVVDGADLLDVGGESTRPGSQAVPAADEIDRVVPVIKRLAAEVDVPVSIDTRKHEVAEAALDGGAAIVNDVSAGEHDPRMFEVIRTSGAGFVLMHMRGAPNTMTELTEYEDVVGEVKAYLRRRIDAAVEAGIPLDALAVDPGLGFAKTTPQSLLLMKGTAAFLDLDRPLLVGPSRKSFIGHVLRAEVNERLEGTAGAVAYLATRGAHIVRVHDVKEMVQVVRVVDAIQGATEEAARTEPEPGS
jgi:dihydropteroate synthase